MGVVVQELSMIIPFFCLLRFFRSARSKALGLPAFPLNHGIFKWKLYIGKGIAGHAASSANENRPFTTVKGRFIEWGKIAVQIVQSVQEIVSEEIAISTVPSTETLPVPKGRIRLSPCRMGSPLMVPLPDRTFTMAKGSSIQNS